MTRQFTTFGISFTGICRGKNTLQTLRVTLWVSNLIWWFRCTLYQARNWYSTLILIWPWGQKEWSSISANMTLQIKWIEKRAVNSKWKLWLHQQNTNLCVYGISAYEYKNKTRLPITGVPVDIELDLHSVLQNKIQL